MSSHENFVSRANKVHSNSYSYPEKYIRAHQSISIECKIHGIFKQKAYSHLAGHGCSKCATLYRGELQLKKEEQFIQECNLKHNFYYDYSRVKYTGTKDRIIIICPLHGEFKQLAQHHLRGSKCPKCVPKKENKKLEAFITEANLKHNNKYTYTEYLGAHVSVEIICPFHGAFIQAANSHLRGRGCPKCQWSNSSKLEKEWLDFLNIEEEKRNKQLIIDDKLYKFDAYCPEANTIYEFYGDFWHGNPDKYSAHDINKKVNKTFGELYNQTIEREKALKQKGFELITIWEKDFLQQTKKTTL
jgi:hypothetical protein